VKALMLMLVVTACANERELSGPCTECVVHVHPPGFQDPSSTSFHGAELERLDWNFALCTSCHGGDFRGGTSGVSCMSCHGDGPTACTTCHGASGPTTAAHTAHRSRGVTCAECHTVPTRWDDDGHIVHDGVAITGPAKVTFGARANITLLAGDRTGPATWDGATCTNVYCHGAVLHGAGGSATTIAWSDPTPPGGCDRCHGQPPPSHARARCAECHPSDAPHIDGVVQIGRVTGCSGCHGSASSPAPPTDLSGNTFTTAIGVGAHQAHLQAASRISAPIACSTCHVVPTAVDSPGHIDSAQPAAVVAALGWDRTSQTCASSCHGPARPVWTTTGGASCGTCHGIPPNDASHTSAMTLATCATCHPQTVDGFGNILVENGQSKHINGVVDLQ
jgi:predicted CxxxxCH...CXXCH cytochrome family protein